MITGEQVKAARKLLGWTQIRLAGRAYLAEKAVQRIESGKAQQAVLDAAVRTLEAAGVEFTNGGQRGVRLKGNLTFDENIKSPHGLGRRRGGLMQRTTTGPRQAEKGKRCAMR